jgi:hypothetical protein
MKFVGKKYNSDLSTKEIAALFRAEVKDLVKKGELPKGLKLSVRYEHFAGGTSISVKIKEAPFGIRNPEAVISESKGNYACKKEYFTADALALVKKLEGLLNAYNFDDSDSMTDYFHVNFDGSVDYDWEVLREEDKIILSGYASLGLD